MGELDVIELDLLLHADRRTDRGAGTSGQELTALSLSTRV
jgi:hypothetical protein